MNTKIGKISLFSMLIFVFSYFHFGVSQLFCHFITPIGVDYQYVTNNQQDFKKKIMMTVGACIFLIAAANALPLFFGISN